MGIEIQIFSNDLLGQVRTIKDDDTILFVARDICSCVGLTHPVRSLRNVDAEDIFKHKTMTNGGQQTLTYVNESGLYQLIFMGKTEKAKKFRRWVTDDVLPTIRKTGGYQIDAPQWMIEEALRKVEKQAKEAEYLVNAYIKNSKEG